MSIKDIETVIVNKLKQDISDLEIRSFPDNISGYNLKHPKGSILVHYNAAKFNPSIFKEVIIQECVLIFDVISVNKNLKGNNGSYEALEKIRLSLTGFKIENCEKMYPTEETFITEENGIWQYGVRFKLHTKLIENSLISP